MKKIPKLKIFERLYWKSDAGKFFDIAFPGKKESIIFLGPIMIWIHK